MAAEAIRLTDTPGAAGSGALGAGGPAAAGALDLTVLIPVFNEGENLAPLLEKLDADLRPLGLRHEVLILDDGSTDATAERLRALRARHPALRAFSFRRNYGKSAALSVGFREARGRSIVTMDGDLQNCPEDIPRLLSKLEEGYDMVSGWRVDRQDPFLRRVFPSRIANWLIGRITGTRLHDYGCSLKAYRASVIKRVPLYGEMHRFIPAMTTQADARIAEIVVNHHPRRFGKSKYGIGRVWRVLLDIITVKMITGFAARAMLWFGFMSGSAMFLGFSVMLVGELRRATLLPEEWTVIYTVGFLLLFLGIHFIALGIVGELTMRTGDFSPQKSLVRSAQREGR